MPDLALQNRGGRITLRGSSGGSGGHGPPEHFEIWGLGNAIFKLLVTLAQFGAQLAFFRGAVCLF